MVVEVTAIGSEFGDVRHAALVTILLVRHAAPEIVPSVDPRHWKLSDAGRRAARQLRARLPASGVWVSSMETKAYETLLCALGHDGAVAQDPGFDEVRRDEHFDGDYEARRTAWVEGHLDERHEGWETPDVTAQRFDSAVAAHAVPGAPIVIASHGMAMTAWLVHGRHVIEPDHASRFWRALAFPDVIEVD